MHQGQLTNIASNAIAKLREDRELTLEEFSDLTGCSRSTIRRIETGTSDIGLKLLDRICETFKLNPTYFLSSEKADILTDQRIIGVIRFMQNLDEHHRFAILNYVEFFYNNVQSEKIKKNGNPITLGSR